VAILLGVLCFVFLSEGKSLGVARLQNPMTLYDLSVVLFRDLLLPFEVTSILILVAILGAVALARKEH
jgi:NADH-quinone oxidoreductase subunit J